MSLKPQGGYTLLELLVALVILSLLTALLTHGISFGTRVWDDTRSRVTAGEVVYAAARSLRETLERVHPALNQDATVRFIGNWDSLSFVAPLPAAMSLGDLYAITLQRDGDKLVIGWTPFKASSVGGSLLQGGRTTTLLNHLTGLNIQYYGSVNNSGVKGWSSRWTDRSVLPELVKIRVSFKEGSHLFWPDLTVRPRVRALPACVFDMVSRTCR